MSRIGEKIMKVRTNKGMSQKQLAKKCGISESYISDVESGKKVVNEQMINRISKALDESLDESIYDEAAEEEIEEERTEAKRSNEKKGPTVEWESAFSSIIKDVPVYNMDMEQTGSRHLPVINKKVEGFNPEKLMYVNVDDNSLSVFRIKKGDTLMVNLGSELSNGFFLLEYEGRRMVRQIKLLGGSKVLLLFGDREIKTETVEQREMKILGRCIRAEIDLSAN